MLRPAAADVPCGNCTLCCRHEFVPVQVEIGDDLSKLRVVPARNLMHAGRPGWRLDQKPNGDCIHLTDGACEVYEDRPATCRIFDCRRLYLDAPRPERRRMARASAQSKLLLARGQDLLEVNRG